MAIIAEFTVPADLLALGRALTGDLTAELERIVPTREAFLPYAWVFGDGFEGFESRLESEPGIGSFSRIAAVDGSRLYEMKPSDDRPDWVDELLEHEFTILDGTGSVDGWVFHLRFPDADAAGSFHDFLNDNGVPFALGNVHRLKSVYPESARVVTRKQREALLLAQREGYFERPRRVSLAELGEMLGIAPSSVSARLRRGHDVMIREYLSGPGIEFE